MELKNEKYDLEDKIIKAVQIKHLKVNGIVDLLRLVCKTLKMSQSQEDIDREKSNFKNSLKGSRNIGTSQILAIEKLAGKSLYEIYAGDDAEFKTPANYEHKGIKYYVFKGTYEAMEELYKLEREDGYTVWDSVDEFGKRALDYIIEFNNIEALRFLMDNGEADNFFKPYYDDSKPKLEAALDMILKADDGELYNSVASYIMLENPYVMREYKEVLCKEENLKRVLEAKRIFDLLPPYEEEAVKHCPDDEHLKTYVHINPLLKALLSVALKEPQKYKEQIRKIIKASEKTVEVICQVLSQVEGRSRVRVDDSGNVTLYDTHVATCLRTHNLSCEDDEVNRLLAANEASIEEIKNKVIYDKERILAGDTLKIDGKIYARPYENPLAYEVFKLAREKNIGAIPKYIETNEDGIDVFEAKRYVDECFSGDYYESQVLGEFLRYFHDSCEEKLGSGRVYCHSQIKPYDIRFFSSSVQRFEGWERCEIGTREKAVKDVLFNVIMTGEARENDGFYENLFHFLKGYGKNGCINLGNLGTEFKNDTLEKLERLKAQKGSYNNEHIFHRKLSLLYARLALAESFEEKLNKIGGGQA